MKNKSFFAKTLSLLIAILFIGHFGIGQTIATQDYDAGTPNWSYTNSPANYSISSDYWDVMSANNDPAGTSGDFWAIRDLNNTNGGGNFEHSITYSAVDISNYTNVNVSFDYYTIGFDGADYLRYEIYKGTSGSEVGQGYVALSKTASSWTNVSIAIPDTDESVYIKITIKQDGGSDYAGLDNFEVTGTPIFSVDDPNSFTATTSSTTQIDLIFASNTDGDDIIIVYDLDNTFSIPSGSSPTIGATFAGGEVLYVGTSSPFNHTALTPSTIHYYKAWSINGTDYSSGLEQDATTLTPIKPEPSNPASGFILTSASTTENTLAMTWSNNDGAQVADGFLIKASAGSNTISDPLDGAEETLGTLIQKIPYGTTSATFSGLNASTTYYFQIYPYTNSGTDIDYLETGKPTLSGTTTAAPITVTIAEQSFEGTGWTYTANPIAFSVGSDVWNEVDNTFHSFGTIPSSGSKFWGVTDLANTYGGTAEGGWGALTFSSVDVSEYKDCEFSFDYEVDGFDTGDDIKYEVFEDGVGHGEILIVDGLSNLNQDGSITVVIADAVSLFYVVVSVKQNGSDYGGVDNFVLTGELANPDFVASGNSVNEVSLSATGNSNILVAWNSTNSFGVPTGSYTSGSSIAGGGTVLYNGNLASLTNHSSLTANTTYYYKAWSVNGTDYSVGIEKNATTLTIPNAWINEIHYDDGGSHNYEFVEIVIENGDSYTLSDFTLYLVNGGDGSFYDTTTVDSYTEGSTTASDYTIYFYTYPTDGLQNDMEGLALVYDGNLIQFLSYEGSFMGSVGLTTGVTSSDIVVSETGTTPDGTSLQLIAPISKSSGKSTYSDFVWNGTVASTVGNLNTDGSDGSQDQSLPIELIEFKAQKVDNGIALSWTTLSEINNDYFTLERSVNGIDFIEIGIVSGAGTSNQEIVYSFIDFEALLGSVYYRLKQTDFDGKYTYSSIITIRKQVSDLALLSIISNNQQIVVQMNSDDFKVRVELYDASGRIVYRKTSSEQNIKIQTSAFNNGLYFLRLSSQDKVISKKIVI